MWFVVIGVAIQVMNLLGIGPVAHWTWRNNWIEMGLPFGCAVLWWFWADTSGWTQRKAMEKVDARREARRQKTLDALGLQDPAKRRR